MKSAHHSNGLAALLFLLLKESDLIAGIVAELENIGEHAACKDRDIKNYETGGSFPHPSKMAAYQKVNGKNFTEKGGTPSPGTEFDFF